MNSLDQLLLGTVLLAFELTNEQLEHLSQATETLSGDLREDRTLLDDAVLAALDARIPDSMPVLEQAETRLLEPWVSLRSKYKTRPVALLRFLILRALRTLSGEGEVSNTVHLLGRDPLRLLEVGDERPALERWYAEFRPVIVSVEDSKPPPRSANKAKVLTLSKVNLAATLQPKIATALTASQYIIDVQNSYATPPRADWVAATSTGLAQEMQDLANTILETVVKDLKPVLESLAPSAFPRLGVTPSQYRALERKTNVMYWLQAHYSASLTMRYRLLPPCAAAVAMAHDLYALDRQVPDGEVEAVLEEALYRLFDTRAEAPHTLLEAFAEICATRELAPILSPPASFRGRDTLIAALGRAFAEGMDTDTAWLEQHLGLAGDTPVTPTQLGLWCLRVEAAQAVRS